MFRIGGSTFYDQKNKIPMKIPEFKRFGIRLITEFRRIPNGFPNQAPPPTLSPSPLFASLFKHPPLTSNTDFWLVVAFLSHLRPAPCPSLYSSTGHVLAPQATEPAMLIANSPPGTFNRLMGSHGAMIWGHDGCCRGNMGQRC